MGATVKQQEYTPGVSGGGSGIGLPLSSMRKPFMRKVLFFLTTFWLVIYSNARMPDNVPSYNVVHLFPIPQAVRLAELLLLVFLFVLAFTRKMQKHAFIVALCTAAFVVLSLFKLAISGSLDLPGIQEIYIRTVPFLFFVVLAQGNKTSYSELKTFITFFVVTMVINILVAVFYQIPLYGDHEDNIHGIFEDAHSLCNYLLVFALVLFYDYLNTGKIALLATSLVLLVLSVFPSNEKVIALSVLLMAVMLVRHTFKKAKGLLSKAFVFVSWLFLLFAGLFYLQKKSGDELWARADILVNSIGIENVGPINAWPIAVNEISGSVSDLLIGVGAGQYGWIAAGRGLNEGTGTKHSRQFEAEFKMDNENNSGFLFRTNTWSSLLAEFGLLGFFLFLIPLVGIVRRVWRYECRNRLEKNLRFVFYILLTFVVFQGFFTPYSNWSAPLLVFPMMYLAVFFTKNREAEQVPDGHLTEENKNEHKPS